MNSSRIALVASAAAAVLWAAKALAISSAGGLGRSRFEGPLFLLGFGCLLVAVVAIGVAATVGRTPAVRGLAAAGGIVSAVAVAVLASGVVSLVEPARPGWAWGEVNLWVLAVGALCGAVRLSGRSASPLR